MRVNLNFNLHKNTLINTARVNASFAKYQSVQDKKSGGILGNRPKNDRFTLSPQGKLINMIENLTKQKQALVDQRNSLVETTLGAVSYTHLRDTCASKSTAPQVW